MNRRSLPLNALRAFESVGRHRSFSLAANELGVTHGAVSRQISMLESLLGLRLFRRSQPIELTDEGIELLAEVAPAFDRLSTAVDSLMCPGDHAALLINAPPTFTMKWLIPRLSVFQRRHNKAEIRLTTSTTSISSLKLSDFDVVIRRLPPSSSDLNAQTFLSGKLVAICAPERVERCPVLCAEDITKHRLIEAKSNVSAWTQWFEQAGCEKPASGDFLRFDEMFFAVQAALEGLGIALAPLSLVADDLAAGNLVIAFDGPDVSAVDYAYVMTLGGRRRQLINEFCTWLSEEGKACDQFARTVI
ncbi:transcriptional regulator [Advenella kashmirensis W13003]|uniref:Transcriptional regulator n=1 Tax=Advenella kashmirensis W13003 TaxID=1424334 RepID=V8QVY4_9BURK|nr:LysR substrate-binding domain-containing protein [Advenella kashmirensis]ETF03159.1 transcriptional regulator [Advenella kashmirensis W13003]